MLGLWNACLEYQSAMHTSHVCVILLHLHSRVVYFAILQWDIFLGIVHYEYFIIFMGFSNLCVFMAIKHANPIVALNI